MLAIIRLLATIALFAMFSVGAACGKSSQLAVATISASSSDPIGFQARNTGILQGQANPDGTACFWLGTGTNRAVIIWPHGFTARDNPLRLVDGDGREEARVGDRITLGGGYLPEDQSSAVRGCSGSYRVRLTSSIVH